MDFAAVILKTRDAERSGIRKPSMRQQINEDTDERGTRRGWSQLITERFEFMKNVASVSMADKEI